MIGERVREERVEVVRQLLTGGVGSMYRQRVNLFRRSPQT
jgi:hypothetical protein